jgi:chemotaxis protein methyltransferase CheR
MLKSPSPALIQEASALIEARTGLACGVQPRVRLDSVLADLSGGDLAGFVQRLRATPESAPDWQSLMRALVIGETYFFRNRVHFNLLASHILPELAARRDKLTIWSTGCSTGEETYSLAITLYERLPDLSTTLIGTDINQRALEAARYGLYREWAFRQTDDTFRTTYFDAVEGGYRVKPFIRSMPVFRAANLLNGAPVTGVDLIFCCNLLLYFEDSAVSRAEDVLYDALAPGGWLILSPAEALRFRRARWTTHLFPGAVAYQKPLTTKQVVDVQWNNHRPPAVSPQPSVAVNPRLYPAAVEAFRADQYDEAARLINELLNHEPRHAAGLTLAACLGADRGDLETANRHLQAALKTAPLHADAHYLNGLLLLEAGEDEAAVEAFRAALYCQQGHPLAAMILGGLHARQGDEARARRVWASALAALEAQPPDAFVCDLSDMTVEGVMSFLNSQLAV